MQANQKPVVWTVVIATLVLLVVGLFCVSSINNNLKLIDYPTAAEIAALVVIPEAGVYPTAQEIADLIKVPETEDISNQKLLEVWKDLFRGQIDLLETQGFDDVEDELLDEYEDDEDFEEDVEKFLSKNIEGFDRVLNNIEFEDYKDYNVEVINLGLNEDDPEDESVKKVKVTFNYEEIEYEKEDSAKDYKIDFNLIVTVTYEDGYPDDPEFETEFVLIE